MGNNKNLKIGISSLVHNLKDALDICKNNKEINHIEIGIDNLSDCEILKQYKDEIKKLNLSVGIHLPMELNPCEDIIFIREKWIEYIQILNNKLNFLEISYYNMHLGYVMTNRLENNRKKYLDNAIDFLNKLLQENNNLNITIENTYTKKGDLSNVGSNVGDFEYIFNKNNNINFCYDNGHNLICKSDYFLIKNKIKVIHLSDNNGIEDEHLGICTRKTTLSNLKEILNNNKEFIVLEMKLDYIEESLNILKKNYIK